MPYLVIDCYEHSTLPVEQMRESVCSLELENKAIPDAWPVAGKVIATAPLKADSLRYVRKQPEDRPRTPPNSRHRQATTDSAKPARSPDSARLSRQKKTPHPILGKGTGCFSYPKVWFRLQSYLNCKARTSALINRGNFIPDMSACDYTL